jgi:hypothetical protein
MFKTPNWDSIKPLDSPLADDVLESGLHPKKPYSIVFV